MSIAIGKTKVANFNNTSYDFLTNTGDGNLYLSDDGNYYRINNFGINDDKVSEKTTYSSEKIDEKIETIVSNIVLPTQNDAPTMWQKTFLNVKPNDVLEMVTSEEYTMDKVIVQAYKFIEGDKDVEETLNKFNRSEEGLFYFNSDNVELTDAEDGKLKIKDSYVIKNTKNSNGYYESELICKDDFIDFYSITVEERL